MKLLAVFVVFVFGAVFAYPMHNSNPISNADANGFARFGKVDFPLSADDPLRMFYLEFYTNPGIEPRGFGAFWHMPVFSSKTVMSKSNEFKWHAPDGRIYSFCAHLTEKKGKEIEAFIDNLSLWRATRKKNGFEISSLQGESSFTYVDGRLTEFTSNDKRKYIINYRRSDGAPLSVKEKSGGTVLAFEYLKDGKHIRSVKNFEGTYTVAYHERKTSDILGTDNFYENALLLSSISRPDNALIDKFEYSKSVMRPRVMLLKDLNEIKTSPLQVRRISMETNGEAKGWLEWCAVTGLIMADSGGEYMIGNDMHDSFFPNFKPGQPNGKFSAIKYINAQMPHPEIHMFDFQNFYEIKGNPATGEIIRNSKIGACGPLKMKTRKVEKLISKMNDDNAWALLKSNSYDDKGRLVRELDALGNIRLTEYFNDKDETKRISQNGEVLYSKTYRNDGSILEVEKKENHLKKTFGNLKDGVSILVREYETFNVLRIYRDEKLIIEKVLKREN